jgi:predicted nucleic acid-binding protein
MRVYADTSALIAWFHPADEFAPSVTSWCREHTVEFCWNHLLRLEVRHNLRRLKGEYGAIAWHAYRAGETSRRLALGRERIYDVLEHGDELSVRFAQDCTAGSWDFVHVAAAQQARAEFFITCDGAQAALARLAGVQHIQLFR